MKSISEVMMKSPVQKSQNTWKQSITIITSLFCQNRLQESKQNERRIEWTERKNREKPSSIQKSRENPDKIRKKLIQVPLEFKNLHDQEYNWWNIDDLCRVLKEKNKNQRRERVKGRPGPKWWAGIGTTWQWKLAWK